MVLQPEEKSAAKRPSDKVARRDDFLKEFMFAS
jgi:hypothetical protein